MFAGLVLLTVLLSLLLLAPTGTIQMSDPSMTPYGERNAGSPQELSVFSFLIGKWEGKGRTRLENGKFAEYDVTWIGRYILDGTAIADELHGPNPDGTPYLGISLRQYDANRRTWIIEYLNVSHSVFAEAGQ